MPLLCAEAVNEGEELKSQTAGGCRLLSLPPVLTWLANNEGTGWKRRYICIQMCFGPCFSEKLLTRIHPFLLSLQGTMETSFLAIFLPKEYIVRSNSAINGQCNLRTEFAVEPALLSKRSYSYPLSQDL